jgi:hypothetical protein
MEFVVDANGAPVMVPAFQRDANGRYVGTDGLPLGTFSNGNLVNPNGRVPVTDASETDATWVGDTGVAFERVPMFERNAAGQYLLSDGRTFPANSNVFNPTHADYDPVLDALRVPVMVDAPSAFIGRYIHAGAPVPPNPNDPTHFTDDPNDALMETYLVRSGDWRLADLDGSNLQRFIREMEADRSWGSAHDFNGNLFGKLQFLSNRLAQGIEYHDNEFEVAMATVQILLDSRDSVSGVCETEEGIHMLKYQRWFNASARLMTTMDEALDTIINRMGRVGL